jgi:serine/threonine protein kinase
MTSSAATAATSDTRVIAQKYRLDTLLGEGGMGTVWRAFNLQLEAPVAIKLLRSDLDSAELGERLRIEARAAAKLVHPNIVRVFDVGEAETGEPFIVMELLDGESLREIIDRAPLPPVSAVQLLLPVAEALSLAHSRGVVHRDIKPDNVFIANVGETLQPKLLDFGIAKVTSSTAARGASVTSTGTVLGSPDYMSPEQALGRTDIDHRSDVWSFCIVLYEALTGRTPFAVGDTPQVVLRAVVQDPVLPLAEAIGLEPGLSAIIERGLSKDRDGRQQSMFELGQELATWLYVQGALEDATGTGLEYKWLGRSNEAVSVTKAQGGSFPRARHDEATLVSVLHPSPLPKALASSPPPLPRRRRGGWLASAAVLGAACWACAAWAVFHEGRAEATSTRSEQVPETPPPAPAFYAAASPPAPPPVPVEPAVAVQAIPLEPAKVAAPIPRPKPTAVVRGSLPRALPAVSARSSRDLLNPY